ncbi:protein phosphatase 2C domain-containing protein [Agromyces atrinae]|uniref:Protein phosphatase n=1 Tax=Agromyces atrinae TaxID=592376 RepID=A0A4Q2M7J4_9MICO|nr:PP2C family serine/threonine-protein phosphatase [Agromyces atrinae]MCI2956848.1 protein phosphatase 2C domain-containing protein [Agromyces atrinae]NYD67797.1 protein phosphatase [Agromyces atrinae]RXZ88019.1 serine/threonine-protein phosphatase [Agromyces atrinae]
MATVKASAAVSHVGKIRSNNQDSGYAGRSLFLVADGMGGHAGGDVASAIATRRIAEADTDYFSALDASGALQEALISANQELAETVFEHAELTGMGTTVSAVALYGDQVVIAHIGDSRIYLMRAGELSQITTDHTFVQRLVDSGRITEEEAMVHPRRSVLMRVLGDVESSPEIDSMILDTREGDRWMICSDGLSGVASFSEIAEIMATDAGAKAAADKLVKASLDGGAPDNVTVVIVDIGEPPAPETPPVIVGSAAIPLAFGTPEPVRPRSILLAPFRLHPVQEAHFEPDSEDYYDELIEEDRRRATRRRVAWLVGSLLIVAGIVVACVLSYQWTQTRYFVGESNGRVAIFQGIQQDLGPLSLHEVYRETNIDVADLRTYDQMTVERTISATSLDEARAIIERLEASLD